MQSTSEYEVRIYLNDYLMVTYEIDALSEQQACDTALGVFFAQGMPNTQDPGAICAFTENDILTACTV